MAKISLIAFMLSISFNLSAERTYPTTIRCQPMGIVFEDSDTKLVLGLDLLGHAASISYKSPQKDKNFFSVVEPSNFYSDNSSLSMTSSSSAKMKNSQIITIAGHYQTSTRVLTYAGFSADFEKTSDKLLLTSLKYNNYNDAFPSGDRTMEINGLNLECIMN